MCLTGAPIASMTSIHQWDVTFELWADVDSGHADAVHDHVAAEGVGQRSQLQLATPGSSLGHSSTVLLKGSLRIPVLIPCLLFPAHPSPQGQNPSRHRRVPKCRTWLVEAHWLLPSQLLSSLPRHN